MTISKFISLVLILILTAVSFFTLTSLLGRRRLFELTTHFKLQYALCLTICAFWFLYQGLWLFFAVAFIFSAINWKDVLPFYFFSSKQNPKATTPLKLFHANMLYNVKNTEAVIAQVQKENPDVLVLQEVTKEEWEDLKTLTQICPHYKSIFARHGDGIILFSRFSFEQIEILDFNLPSRWGFFAEFNINGAKVSLVTIHPPTPLYEPHFNLRNAQLAHAAKLVREKKSNKILIGDFNLTPFSPYYRDLLRDSGLRDVRQGKGLLTTWPAHLPPFLRIAIDHCLVSDEINVKAIRLGNRVDSDHLPLIVELLLEKYD
jgi:endonuclease/exonuclease/phosphatase (EEP) superfamily protein YafD